MNTLTLTPKISSKRQARSHRLPSQFANTEPVDGFSPSQREEAPLLLLTPPSKVKLSANGQECPVEKTFKDTYHTELYQSRQCGNNVRRLLDRIGDPEKLKGMRVLGIENKGFSHFGLVRAVHTRGTGREGELRVTDHNWYHHVVLEKDGKILDFDFDVEPRTPTVQEYFQENFFSDTVVAKEKKLSDYRIQEIDAQEYLDRNDDTSKTTTLGEYLSRY